MFISRDRYLPAWLDLQRNVSRHVTVTTFAKPAFHEGLCTGWNIKTAPDKRPVFDYDRRTR